MGTKLTRRDFLKILGIGFIELALVAVSGVGYGALVEPWLFQVENVQLKLKRLPRSLSGIRIAQLSDIHMGGWMDLDRLMKVVQLITEQNPHIVLLTGDFVVGHRFNDSSRLAIKDLIQALSPLASSTPSFAVLGNHDYWTNAQAVRDMFSSCGIMDLTNTTFPFSYNGDTLYLCGVDDVWEGNVRLDDVIAQLADNAPAILMAHEPDFADTSAATGRFDLQVSGHTHGGQIVFPLLGPPVLPYLGMKYTSGLYQVGNMYQYTNRGIGMGRIPMRLNCKPEITIFQLESTT
jgi:predicted MPP superfamily phosphohydrolase